MLETAVAAMSSGGLGAIVGLVGGIASRFQQYKMRKVELEHESKMRAYDVQEAKLERQHDLDLIGKNIEKAEIEGDIAYDKADLSNLKESIKQANKDSGIPIVEVVRGLMRPFITLFLLMCTCVFAAIVWDEVGGLDSFSQSELIDLFRHIVNQMVFLTVTAVSWWFASRPARLDREKK